MRQRVVISQAVYAAVDAQVTRYLADGAPPGRVAAWLTRLYDLIDSLARRPLRHPVAEAAIQAKGYKLRRVNLGEYAVYYLVQDDRRVVEVLAFTDSRRHVPHANLPDPLS